MSKRVRDDSYDSDSEPEVTSAKRLRSDLLDDSELETQSTRDLATVMKSFEEEICVPVPPPPQPELGYLLEASDDELGLPPAFSEENVNKEEGLCVESETRGFEDQIWRFEDEIQSYEFGIANLDDNDEFLALNGLFDHADMYSGQSFASDYLYRPEMV